MSEYGIEKVEQQPLVQSGAYIDPSTDPDGAEASLIALVGTPSDGDVPTFDSSIGATGAFTPQAPSGGGGAPSGPAGGVLSGTYPDPSFAADMATQAELDAAVAALKGGVSTAFDTLAEIATELALKAPLASPTFTGTVTVPDDAYDATTWNGNLTVPTKNAVRDKIEALGAGVSDGDKGDITVSASGAPWTIHPDAVVFSKIQNIATNRLLGRSTASSGDVEEITPGTGLTLSGGTLSVTPGTGGGIAGSYLFADPTKTNGDGSTKTFESGDHSPTVVNASGLTYDANTTVPGALWMKIAASSAQWKGLLWALPGDTNYTIGIPIEVGCLNANIALGAIMLADTTAATGGNAAAVMLGQHGGISGFVTCALRQATNFMNAGDTAKLSLAGLGIPAGTLYISKNGSNYSILFSRRGGFARIVDATTATLSFTPTHFGIAGYNNNAGYDLEIVAHAILYAPTAGARFGGARDIALAT